MADLLTESLSINIQQTYHIQQPFTCAGIDYFGPICGKFSGKTRGNQAIAKRYEAIFICLIRVPTEA